MAKRITTHPDRTRRRKAALIRRKADAVRWALVDGDDARRRRELAEAEVATLSARTGAR